MPAAVRRKRFLLAVANHAVLIAAAIAFLAPFVFIALTALMTNDQALSSRPLAASVPLAQLRRRLHEGAALALDAEHAPVLGARDARRARLERPGRLRARPAALARAATSMFMIVLVALMLPPQVSVVPLYVMWAKFHPFGITSSARSGR